LENGICHIVSVNGKALERSCLDNAIIDTSDHCKPQA